MYSSEKQNNLFIITESYPFIGGEQFLYNEFSELTKHYETVYFFPLKQKQEILKNLPNNVLIDNAFTKIEKGDSNLVLFTHFLLLLKIIFLELTKNQNGLYFFKNIGYQIATFKKSIKIAETFKLKLSELGYQKEDVILSSWMNIATLSLSILKHKKEINKFSFRINGYDIFNERHPNNYMPFKGINYASTDNIIVLSKAGKKHVLNQNIFPEKITQNYSGLYDLGMNPISKKENEFTIVSVSNIIPIKRVELIVKALALTKHKMTWIHFGDGSLKTQIESLCKELPENITAVLKGSVPRNEIIDFYKSTPIDLFVHPSETEGLGMAIIEAQSFGIPAIGCKVGGVPEIINQNTGVLLPEKITEIDLQIILE
ncbi:MAG: glycosyltransferase, partial [Putridiphycobacter sp.]